MKQATLTRGLGAVASGLLLAATFPKLSFSILAWFALVPLILVARDCCPQIAARYGFVAGVAFFAILQEWIRIFDTTGWVALTLFMALYVALFAACVSALAPALGGWRGVLIPAAAWTATEWMRGHGPLAFTWGGLAYSLHWNLPLVQLASVTGPYGLTFLVAAANCAVAAVVRSVGAVRRASPEGVAKPDADAVEGARPAILRLGVVSLAVAACWGWGQWRMSRPLPAAPAVTVAVLQGSIGGEGDRWGPFDVEKSARIYLGLTEEAARQGARIVVWPESSVPALLELSPDVRDIRDAIARRARGLQISIVVGSSHRDREDRALNSAFLYNPDGRLRARYDKVHLVPYGEYTPWRRRLDFIYRHFPVIEQEFSPGRGFFPLRADAAPLGTAICFESAFPEIARALRRAGAQVLVVITNDGWFGYRSATRQHFSMASFRAVETGAYLARAATTGISAIVDPYGRSLVQSEILERRMLVARVVPAAGQTAYMRVGDVVAWACIAVVLALLVVERQRRRA